MTFLPVRGPGRIQRLPILDPNDQSVPEHVRDRYALRRCVIWYEGYGRVEGNLVAGGRAPFDHPNGQQYRFGAFPSRHPDREQR
jgi:hypothetical protein